MKARSLAIALALTLAPASLAAQNGEDVRSLWLRGEWKKAEAKLERNSASARRSGDRHAQLSALRDRVFFLLDRNSYSRHDPALLRVEVESFYDAASQTRDIGLLADAFHAMGRYHYWQMFSGEGEWKSVADLLQRALELREAAGNSTKLADSHFYLGLVHQMQEQAAPARAAFERGLAFASSDPLMQSFLERHLGALDEDAGNHELAHRRYTASLELRRRAGATLLVPFALNLLASHEESFRKNVARATELYRESAAVAKRTGSTRALSNAEGELARLAQARGNRRAALKHARKSVEAARAHGDPELVREAVTRESDLRSEP